MIGYLHIRILIMYTGRKLQYLYSQTFLKQTQHFFKSWFCRAAVVSLVVLLQWCAAVLQGKGKNKCSPIQSSISISCILFPLRIKSRFDSWPSLLAVFGWKCFNVKSYIWDSLKTWNNLEKKNSSLIEVVLVSGAHFKQKLYLLNTQYL